MKEVISMLVKVSDGYIGTKEELKAEWYSRWDDEAKDALWMSEEYIQEFREEALEQEDETKAITAFLAYREKALRRKNLECSEYIDSWAEKIEGVTPEIYYISEGNLQFWDGAILAIGSHFYAEKLHEYTKDKFRASGPQTRGQKKCPALSGAVDQRVLTQSEALYWANPSTIPAARYSSCRLTHSPLASD